MQLKSRFSDSFVQNRCLTNISAPARKRDKTKKSRNEIELCVERESEAEKSSSTLIALILIKLPIVSLPSCYLQSLDFNVLDATGIREPGEASKMGSENSLKFHSTCVPASRKQPRAQKKWFVFLILHFAGHIVVRHEAVSLAADTRVWGVHELMLNYCSLGVTAVAVDKLLGRRERVIEKPNRWNAHRTWSPDFYR